MMASEKRMALAKIEAGLAALERMRDELPTGGDLKSSGAAFSRELYEINAMALELDSRTGSLRLALKYDSEDLLTPHVR